jgi:hypothetical protein
LKDEIIKEVRQEILAEVRKEMEELRRAIQNSK